MEGTAVERREHGRRLQSALEDGRLGELGFLVQAAITVQNRGLML